MSQATLRSVTLETIANYRQVAEHAVGAYRASGHRLLAVMEKGLDRTATRGAERVAPQLAAALRRTSGKVSSAAAKGIDTVSAQTERVIELGSKGVTEQVARVADIVEGIENKYVATGLQAAARLSLAGAQAALTLSSKLAEGAGKLQSAVAAEPKPVKKAKAIVKRTRKAAAKPVAEVAKAVKTVRTRRTAAAKSI